MNEYSFETCMDIFDWFDTDDYEYLAHVLVSKSDADTLIARAMPEIRKRAHELVLAHRGCENAYPEL